MILLLLLSGSPRDRVVKKAASRGDDEMDLVATQAMCGHCFDVLIKHLKSSTVAPPELTLPANVHCPLFVTWEINRKREGPEDYHLRGCIGSLSAKELSTSLGEYSLLSALKDRRFAPISLNEVVDLRVGVSLLVKYEHCQSWDDWQVGVHGIILKFTVGVEYSATYLPEVAPAQKWNQYQCISSLIRKTGYRGVVDDCLLAKLRCTRYQSSKARLSFDEYNKIRNHLPAELMLVSSDFGKEKSTNTCGIM